LAINGVFALSFLFVTMTIIDELIRDHFKRLDQASGFVEYVGHIVFFMLTSCAVGIMMLAAGVCLITVFCNWWHGPGGAGVAVGLAKVELMPPVADAVIPPAGDGKAARAIRRRSRAAHDSALGESDLSSSSAT
jgi:hypothetical protein